MKKYSKILFILHLSTLFCISLIHSQVEIIKDYFDFEKATFDIYLKNTGTESVKLDSVMVDFDWYKIRSNLTSGGGKKIIKPVAEIIISIPFYGAGVASLDIKQGIILIPNRLTRIRVGLDLDLGHKRHGLDSYELNCKLFLKFRDQVISTVSRTLENDLLEKIGESANGGMVLGLPYISQEEQWLYKDSNENTEDQKENQGNSSHEMLIKCLRQPLSPIDSVASIEKEVLIDELKWLYSRSYREDSVKTVYESALNHLTEEVRCEAIKGIRLLRFNDFGDRLKKLLSLTNSKIEARASAKALFYFDIDYQDILVSRLQNPSTPSQIKSFCAMELLKLGHNHLAHLLFEQLSNEQLNNEDYFQIRLAYQLTSDSNYKDELYKLIQDKIDWSTSGNPSLEYKFSQLILLTLFDRNSEYFLPQIKEVLNTGRADSMTLSILFYYGNLINTLNKGDGAQQTRSSRFVGYFNKNVTYPSRYDLDYSFKYLYGDTIKVNFRFDSRFDHKFFYHLYPLSIDWLKELHQSFPQYFSNASAPVRHKVLLHSIAFNKDESQIKNLISKAILDSAAIVRRFAANYIITQDLKEFKHQIIHNLSHANGERARSEISLYCNYLGDECKNHLLDAMGNYLQIPTESLKAILNYLEYYDKRNIKEEFANHFPAIFKYHHDRGVKWTVLNFLEEVFEDQPIKLKPYVITALKDTSSQIRNLGIKMMMKHNISGLEEIVIENLKREKDLYTMADYYKYLEEKCYPIVYELLNDLNQNTNVLEHHLENIRTIIPNEDWKFFEQPLDALIKDNKNSTFQLLILSILCEFKKPESVLHYFHSILRDPTDKNRILATELVNKYQISGLNDQILKNFRNTDATVKELSVSLMYLGYTAFDFLKEILSDEKIPGDIKRKYLKALYVNRETLDFNSFDGAIDFFYEGKEVIYRIATIKNLVKDLKSEEIQLQFISRALGDSNYKVREEALKFVLENEISGLSDDLLIQILYNRESSLKEKVYCIKYLEQNAVPIIEDILLHTGDEEITRSYLKAISQNFSYLNLSALNDEFEYLQKNFNRLGKELKLLQCLLYLQQDSVKQANDLIDTPSFLKEIERLAYSIPIIEKTAATREAIIGKIKAHEWETTKLGRYYGIKVWYYLFNQAFDNAEQAARIGLELAPSQTWIVSKLALGLLYQGKYEEAKQVYLKYKDQADNNGTLFKDIFMEDFENLEKEKITHPDVEKIRALLN